jgi:hypothetical protein
MTSPVPRAPRPEFNDFQQFFAGDAVADSLPVSVSEKPKSQNRKTSGV